MVRTSGNWLREGQALVLDDVAIAGLEYTLPENWKTLWMDPLPVWLNSVTLKKFGLSRNTVIDIDPAFPWQITSLDGYGANLRLAQDHKWGVWGGNATLNRAAATFNRVDVRRPSLALNANAATVNITDLSAFTERDHGSDRHRVTAATATNHREPERARCTTQRYAAVGLASAADCGRRQYSAHRQRKRAGQCAAEADGEWEAERGEYG